MKCGCRPERQRKVSYVILSCIGVGVTDNSGFWSRRLDLLLLLLQLQSINSSQLGIPWKMDTTRRQIPGSKIPKDVTYSFSYSICLLLDPFGVCRLFVPRRSKQETLYQGNESLIINSSKMCINTQRENLDYFPLCLYASPSTIEIDNCYTV
jgi:hypothetical protein